MKEKPTTHTMTRNELELVRYVMGHLEPWKEHRQQNYDLKWDEYERLYRGIWASEDKTRESERAKVVSPAIQQAVDSRVAELSEAVLSRNEFFDIDDDMEDQDPTDVAMLRRKMGQNFKKDKVRKAIQDVLQLGGIYGTGVAEIVMKKVKDFSPAKEQMTPDVAAVGVNKTDRLAIRLHPVHPRNFIADPLADCLDEALGYAIEEKVPLHTVVKAMVEGDYKLYSLYDNTTDQEIEADGIAIPYKKGSVVVYRWYGQVPKNLLDNLDKEEEDDDKKNESELDKALDALGNDEYDDYSDLVDAIVHIAEGTHLLKAVANPNMMGDRPCVVYRPQTLSGRFWGVGDVEKGYSMQKSLDGQIRAHLDSIALTAAPMVGIDASRLPRGFKMTVSPGRTILTNGNPSEIIQPIMLGQPQSVNIETAQLFERFLQQATGTLDSAGLPSQVNNQTDASAMSMALSGIIKKHKQALLNFQEGFLIPFIERAAWRFMQFDPDNFPVKDFNFVPASTMGIMAREYEQQQFIALLQTLGPDSKIVPLVLKGIIENSSLSKREELMAELDKMMQPDPQQEQMQQQLQQLEQQMQQLQMALVQAQVQETQAKAQNYQAEAMLTQTKAQVLPQEVQAKLAAALSNNLDDDAESADFERRAKITELMLKEKDLELKEKDISSNERISQMQTQAKHTEVQTKAVVERMKLQRDKEGNLTVTKSRE